jgi:hypothetical protein
MQYIQSAKELPSSASLEYKVGNYTGAEELATLAYLDDFEHVLAILILAQIYRKVEQSSIVSY